MKPLLPTVLATCLMLPAQKVAMTDGSDRQAVILDVGDLLPENRGMGAPQAPVRAGRSAATMPTEMQRLVAFVRAFTAPLGEPGADLQALGDRHLVVLGSPVQVAAAERLVAHARKTRTKEFHVDLRLCEVPTAIFDKDVAPLLPKVDGAAPDPAAPQASVLDAAATQALLNSLKRSGQVKLTQFPQVVSPSLYRAKMMVGNQLTYVRDFEVEAAGGTFVANPVVDVLFDGHDVEVMCGETREGTIGVQMQLVDQKVEKPIPELVTTLPGTTMEVKVQVPRFTGCRGGQTVEMAPGATAIMAARKNDGSWLISLMTLHELGPGAPMPNRDK